MAKPTRIALDLTLLLDLAANDAAALAGLKAAREAFPEVEFVVSPVTRQALALAMVSTTYDSEIRSLANTALKRLTHQWGFPVVTISGADLWVSGESARQLIATGLIGGHAIDSAHTVAEAACLGCSVLLCHDPELLVVDYAKLKKTLDKLDRGALWITTPGEILRQARSSQT